MERLLRVGIVGCGAIGSSLAKAIVNDFSGKAILAALFDIDGRKSLELSRLVFKSARLRVANLNRLISSSDLVIEAASAKSSWEIAQNTLKSGRDIMIMSVGGVAGRLRELSKLARRYSAKVYIPSGAISGIDALKAQVLGKITKVTLTTRKHPEAFREVSYLKNKGISLDKIKKDTLLFSGKAREAIVFFPQNINVAALLSIAGIGSERTEVKIIASPKAKRNIHEIEIESSCGKVFSRTENILHPENPRTSYLAVLSAVATLKQVLEPVKIGT